MQTLWTRAALARSFCNCSACVAATKGLARRAGKAHFRQCVPRPETFGLVTSTLVFSAALFDSARKDSRLRDWDKRLEEKKAEIEAVDQSQEKRLAKLADLSAGGLFDQSILAFVWQQSWWKKPNWGKALEWAVTQQKQREDAGFEELQGVPFTILQMRPKSTLKRLLAEKRILRQFYGGPSCSDLNSVPHLHPLSTKKLRTLEWSMLKLIAKILDTVSGHDEEIARTVCSLAQSQDFGKSLDDINNVDLYLKGLRSETMNSDIYRAFPFPIVPNYHFSPCERNRELKYLNEKLSQVLNADDQMTTGTLLELCRKLISMRVAPDIHTYNVLLVRFCELREPQLVDAVLESVLASHTKPNEITHTSVLRFYTATKNKKAFSDYLRKMNGFCGGLALAHPNRSIGGIVNSRYRFTKSKTLELARLNGEVYTSIIKGMIEMFRPKEAMWYFVRMISEGWRPTMELLTEMLRSCCRSLDISSGWRVWETMIQRQDETIDRDTCRMMLRLCKARKDTTLFKHVLLYGLRARILYPSRSAQKQHQQTNELTDTSTVSSEGKKRRGNMWKSFNCISVEIDGLVKEAQSVNKPDEDRFIEEPGTKPRALVAGQAADYDYPAYFRSSRSTFTRTLPRVPEPKPNKFSFLDGYPSQAETGPRQLLAEAG